MITLNNVRIKNDISQWIKFFLVGIIETSKKGIYTFKSILKLKEEIDDKKLVTLGAKLTNAKLLMKYLYKKPVVTAQEIKEAVKCIFTDRKFISCRF